MHTTISPTLVAAILADLMFACSGNGAFAGKEAGSTDEAGTTGLDAPTDAADAAVEAGMAAADVESEASTAGFSDVATEPETGPTAIRDWGEGTDEAGEAGREAAVGAEGGGNSGDVVLFGGWAAQGDFADTWLWDGVRWTAHSVTGPSARIWSSMAAANGKTVLFGGADSGNRDLGDTWVWDGSSWTQQNVAGPSARHGAAMATLNGQVVLFGGSGGPLYGDTWVWDGRSWTQQNASGPAPRDNAAMATLNGKVVLFGGDGGFSLRALADTWEWDGTTWTQRNVSGPGTRVGARAAALGDRVVLFGGSGTPNDASPAGFYGDTWIWDGATWAQQIVPGPSPRWYLGMATLNDTLVLFGGQILGSAGEAGAAGADGALGDTWLWDGARWTQENVAGPGARDGPAMSGP